MKYLSFSFLLIFLILTYYFNMSETKLNLNNNKNANNKILNSKNLKNSISLFLNKKNGMTLQRGIASTGNLNYTALSNQNTKSRFESPNIEENFRVNYTLIQQKEVARILEQEISEDEEKLQKLDLPDEKLENAIESKRQLLEEMNQIIDALEAENYHKDDYKNE